MPNNNDRIEGCNCSSCRPITPPPTPEPPVISWTEIPVGLGLSQPPATPPTPLEVSAHGACECCGNDFAAEESQLLVMDGNSREMWCATCLDDSAFRCRACNTHHHNDDSVEVQGTNSSWCQGCAAGLSRCECCDGICHDDILTTVQGGELICDSCRRESDRYGHCPSCDETFRMRESCTGERCPSCEREHEEEEEQRSPILSYSTRVDTTPEGKGPIWFGIELEVEVKSGSDTNEMATKCKELLGEFAIIKSDGSLNNGFEMVTRPASLEVHRERWTKFMEKRPKGIRSWETTTCGMHVHLTRRAHDGSAIMTDLTVAKIVMFVNSPRNKAFIVDIAGRDADRWAKMQDKESLPKALRAIERYEAVNLLNKRTIEFRIFRGTLSYAGFMKNLEFTAAVKDFCAQAGRSLTECQSLTSFKEFVNDNKKGYPFLYRFINTK